MPTKQLPSSCDPAVIKTAAEWTLNNPQGVVVAEAETSFGLVEVKSKGKGYAYDVCVDGVVKHPNSAPDDVIRALCHYLNSEGYKISKAGIK
jgi:hypothetical protein